MNRNLLKNLIPFLGMILLAGSAFSCDDADEGSGDGARFTLGETLYGDDNSKTDVPLADDYVWENNRSGAIKAFYIYSDLNYWTVEPTSEEDRVWVEIWPGAGSSDGRFYVRILPNETAAERETQLQIRAGGRELRTIRITQQAGVAATGAETPMQAKNANR